jgi:hypothetical protein
MTDLIKLEQTKELISQLGLDRKDRTRNTVFRRAIFMNFLRKHGLTLVETGKLFNLDHSSVIHNLKTYDAQKMYEDFRAIEYFMQSDLSQLVDYQKVGELEEAKVKKFSPLEFRILGVTSMRELKKIKAEIVKGCE